jgi:hypothetical protein
MKSWNLKFLESFGPLQACKGTALPAFSLPIGFSLSCFHVIIFSKDFSKLLISALHFLSTGQNPVFWRENKILTCEVAGIITSHFRNNS